MNVNTNPKDIDKFFDHKLDKIYPSEQELRNKLLSGEKLKFYIGADATAPKLHLGHLIPILKLKYLQELGHQIIFLIGDFTARLGDPTDKAEVRKLLSVEEVNENASNFKNQIAKYIQFEGTDNDAMLVFNADWHSKLTFADVIDLASNVTVQQMIERDMFSERINSKKPIYLHEFLYPLIQGYDSVELEVDGEFGGRDQTFNMLMGRTLLKNYKNKDKFVITTHFLLSAEGESKMSKSVGNCIFIDDKAEDKYAKVMSIPDNLIVHFYQMATDKNSDEIIAIEKRLDSGEDPMSIKKTLAFEITEAHDGTENAHKAQKHFEDSVQNNQVPENAPTFSRNAINSESISLKELLAITNLLPSNAEAKRLTRSSAIEVNGEVITDFNKEFTTAELNNIRVGKKNWLIFKD